MSQQVVSVLLSVGLSGAIGAIAWLVKTVIANTRDLQSMRSGLEGEDSKIKLWARENLVAREDYVPQTSLISSKLDSVAARLERLDERLAMKEGG